jgi:hypothetical protein
MKPFWLEYGFEYSLTGRPGSWSKITGPHTGDGGFDTRAEAEAAIPRRARYVGEADPNRYRVRSRAEAMAPAAKAPVLTTDKQARKEMPIARGLFDYFPLAVAEVAHVSFKANEQHNPGEPMHWARGKSTDHADCIARHLIERGAVDDDGLRHTAKLAWRALALLQEELEAAKAS